MDAIPLLGWYIDYHRPFKREVVFLKQEQFHPPFYTWPRGRIEYHPHRVLFFSALDLCDMILNRQIKQGGSTVRNDWACRCVQVGKRWASKHCSTAIGSSEEIWWVEIKVQAQMRAGIVDAIYSWWDAKFAWLESLITTHSTGTWVRGLFGPEILLDWYLFSSSSSILYLKCGLDDDPIRLLLAKLLWIDYTASALFVFWGFWHFVYRGRGSCFQPDSLGSKRMVSPWSTVPRGLL